MARSDLLVNLVRASKRGDRLLLKKTVEAIVAEERAKQHNVLADKLEKEIRQSDVQNNGPTVSYDRMTNLIFEMSPERQMDDLILPEVVKKGCADLVEEHHRRDLLRSYNLKPRNRVLLEGPPGNGKTSLAEALASALMVPIFVVRYEGVIGTYLGETAVRLKRVFDYVSSRNCILFFDEFDTLGKERGDVHETGEIKRVVSSLLLQIDALPSHVVVITATNHAELLDRAVWRRFQIQFSLPPPSRSQATKWFERFAKKSELDFGYAPGALADKLTGCNYSELEDFCVTILRRYVMSLPEANIKKITTDCLQQWQARMKVAGRFKTG
jgi:SpoVK/Ycf46/Vps4 family AAA+-type ATPase